LNNIVFGDGVGNKVEENSKHILPNVNVLAAINSGMHAVKICPNRFLPFLTWVAG